MEDVVALLYTFNAFIIIVAYVPQLIKLRNAKSKPVIFSIPSWTLWTYSSLIAFLYASLVNGDSLFIFISGLGLFFVSLTLLIIIYKYSKYANFK